jgi:hypothetical protein
MATLAGPLQVTGTLTVQSGGILLATQCQPLTRPGSFVLVVGANYATAPARYRKYHFRRVTAGLVRSEDARRSIGGSPDTSLGARLGIVQKGNSPHQLGAGALGVD